MVDAWRSEVHSIWPALAHEREMQRKVLLARQLWVWLSTVWMLPSDPLAPTGPDADVEAPDFEPADVTAAGFTHDWALHTNDPRVIVSRWTDLAAAAGRAGDEEIAVFATAMGVALQRIWLA